MYKLQYVTFTNTQVVGDINTIASIDKTCRVDIQSQWSRGVGYVHNEATRIVTGISKYKLEVFIISLRKKYILSSDT